MLKAAMTSVYGEILIIQLKKYELDNQGHSIWRYMGSLNVTDGGNSSGSRT